MEDANVLAESKKLPLDRSSKQDRRRRRAHIVIGGGAVALDEEIKQMIAHWPRLSVLFPLDDFPAACVS